MNICPKCGSNEYGPGPNYDNLRWIGCYKCGYGFKKDMPNNTTKPNIFRVTRTPKGFDQILSVKPDVAASFYCAVINVSDSPCATFDYQMKLPSFWFPIQEVSYWGYSPFYGALKVVNEYFKGDKPVLIHCHAGANRSPSVAYAILLSKGYSPEEAEQSLNYPGLSLVFKRNIERKQIPKNIVEFLIKAQSSNHEQNSLCWVLRNIDADYEEWSQKRRIEQNDCIVSADLGLEARLVYDKETKKFIVVKEEPTSLATPPPPPKPDVVPFVDPIFKREEWYITPLRSE